MIDKEGRITYRGQEYRVVFNLNVMENIQEKYGTIAKWANLTEGSANKGEPNAQAIIFGFCQMLNEGIEIDNEENGTDNKLLSLRQCGRIITEVGITQATEILQDTVVKSTKSDEKNA